MKYRYASFVSEICHVFMSAVIVVLVVCPFSQ